MAVKRKFIKVEEKRMVKKRKGEICIFCGCTNKLILNIDHIIPLARGGENTDKNKQVTCSICNSIKGALSNDEFRKYLKALYILYDLRKVKLNNLPLLGIKFDPNQYPPEHLVKRKDEVEDGRVSPKA